MQSFRKLAVWRKAHELTVASYRVSSRISQREVPGLGSQIRRATATIPGNIAEGSGFESAAQFAKYLSQANASAQELDYHFELARDLGALPSATTAALQERVWEVRRMLTGLIRRVRESVDLPGALPDPSQPRMADH